MNEYQVTIKAHRKKQHTMLVHARQTFQRLNNIRVNKLAINLARFEKSVVSDRLFQGFITL